MADSFELLYDEPFEGLCVNCEQLLTVRGSHRVVMVVAGQLMEIEGPLCDACYEGIYGTGKL